MERWCLRRRGSCGGAGGKGLQVHHCLVGLDLREHIAALHMVALGLAPFDDDAFFHRIGQLGHNDATGHGFYFLYKTVRTAAITRSTSGITASSRFRAYGMGTSRAVTRTIGP